MTTTDPMVARIQAALNELAEAAYRDGGIAAELLAHGDRGKRNSRCGCPVAVYLHRVTGVWVQIDDLTGWEYRSRHGYSEGLIPQEVAEFIAEMDGGEHPRLDVRVAGVLEIAGGVA